MFRFHENLSCLNCKLLYSVLYRAKTLCRMDIGEISAWAALVSGMASGFYGLSRSVYKLSRWMYGLERDIKHLQKNKEQALQAYTILETATNEITITLAEIKRDIHYVKQIIEKGNL